MNQIPSYTSDSKARAEHPADVNREWVTFTRNLFMLLNRHSGVDITFRIVDEAIATMSEHERVEAESRAFEASALRRGYAEALNPLQGRFLSGALTATSPEAWKIIFFVQNAQYRPKPAELDVAVRNALNLPLGTVEGHVAEQRQVVTLPKVLGIPSATSDAAVKDIATINKRATRIEQIPERDDRGNLIGIGRRQFILASIRMKQGLNPLPSGDAFSDGDEDEALAPISKEQEVGK